ncbi:GMC oxidoreductase [Gloeocapsopsis dulcis]|uniref:GMC oxidoreductase n=1 Tax=Gloeocapsopsis dulcis AAB1 = 1H9 TaxID=1433147 RepID=A0A6N8G244_9CHRO|nr:GMC family oxidoreductase [Gloeocapsopsis dulcis]MUL38962.1 GMC oxidoreductase [Gloeocapsopsis dulcis AAB1 = 1H9]WNN89545.1 GMC family oxidoreductase [Gloeocapsopsis dulcis]
MLIDTLMLPENTLIESDICIVGAGAAGITLARELCGQPYKICLLESGGLDFDEVTQSLYQGKNVGVPYFPVSESRARHFGGSTNLWGGTCRPLDEIDFEYRPWMPYSSWPFTKAELNPYYKRSQKVCGLERFDYEFADWENDLRRQYRFNLPLPEDRLVTYMFQVMSRERLRFGEVYKTEFEQAANINIYLHANVVNIETNDTAKAVTRLHVANLAGHKFWVSAKIFILACGGIENPRLLLASNSVCRNGLGNQYDLVGRFFMEHPYIRSGKILLAKPNALYPTGPQQKIQVAQTRLFTALALSKTVQEREQILNFAVRLVPIFPEWLKALQRLKNREEPEKAFNDRFSSVVSDLSKVIANLDKVIARTWVKRKFKHPPFPQQFFETHLISEQAPNPDSRVMLSSERDKLGIPRIQLDWRLSPIDKYTIYRSQQLIQAELARTRLGQVQIELTNDDTSWRSLLERSQQILDQAISRSDSSQLEIVLHEDKYWQSLRGSYHHIGTTRMSTNPKLGVVNADCQVHGISNLYVTGSSVFPTSGLSNPTLTIVALAIRLADHIKDRMQVGIHQKVIPFCYQANT